MDGAVLEFKKLRLEKTKEHKNNGSYSGCSWQYDSRAIFVKHGLEFSIIMEITILEELLIAPRENIFLCNHLSQNYTERI